MALFYYQKPIILFMQNKPLVCVILMARNIMKNTCMGNENTHTWEVVELFC